MAKGRYTFLKWNGKYNDEAFFIVRDNETERQAYFIPGKPQESVWVDRDLTRDPETKNWEGFGNETVDDLEDVVF